MIELDPFPHNCGNILDFNIIGPERVLLTCAICHRTITLIENFASFKIKIDKKIYPQGEEAQYSEQTIKDLV